MSDPKPLSQYKPTDLWAAAFARKDAIGAGEDPPSWEDTLEERETPEDKPKD